MGRLRRILAVAALAVSGAAAYALTQEPTPS